MGLYGGSSGGGETKFEYNDEIKPYMDQLLSQIGGEGQRPYQQFQGTRIAGLGDADTVNSSNIVRSLALGGTPEAQAANQMIDNTLAGNYGNPYMDKPVTPGQNQYEGENPYFDSIYNRGAQKIVQNYQNATAPQTDAAFVMNGTFGGGDYQRAVDKNQAALAQGLTDYTSGMFGQQYDRSAQLKESDLGRQMSADTFNANLGNQDWEAERQRQMAAVPQAFGSLDETYKGANAMMGLGDLQRQYQQNLINTQYGDWQDQYNYNRNNLGWQSGMFSGAMGGLGPNQITSQTYNPALGSQLLGGALAGYGMFRG